VRYIVKLNRILKAANIQLLHCNGLKPNILGSILCRFFGWPTVCHVRDELKGMRLRLFKRCHRWSSIHIVANSQATLRAMSISARARVVYNGMGLPDSETTLRACSKEDVKLVARKSCGLEKLNVDTPVLVAVGHLAPLKGYETFLASLVQLRPKWPKLRVFIVGGAPYVAFQEEQRRLYDLCSEWRLNEMVTWVGASSNPLGWIRSSDMVVQPSLTEGLGRTSIEAGLCSRPTVASRVGGLPEVVLDGDTGLLVPPNDPKALATAIDRLLSAPELQVSMGAEAFRHVQKKFSLSSASQATLRLYRELL
jgi:glycosyltransferase involved in cell wall biosynthesis